MRGHRRSQFLRFAKMRMEGRNDLIYRSYTLADYRSLYKLVAYAGYRPQIRNANWAMLQAQADIRNSGFPEITIERTEELLREFIKYSKIQDGLVRKPQKRSSEDIQRLYLENQEAKARLTPE